MSFFSNRIGSNNRKVLFQNFISLSSIQLMGMILPLISLPYVLRVIGFDNYGIIVFATSLINYFTSLTDYSFKITAVRDIAVFKESKKKLNFIYSKVLIVKFIFLCISLFLISSIVFLYPPFYENGLIFILCMLILVGHALFPDWFFQGIEKMRYLTFLNIGIKIFFTICIFIFIKEKDDYWIYPLLQGAGFIGAGLVGQLILIYTFKLKFYWLSWRIIKNTIVSNFPIFINQFVPTLYNNTSTFLLGLMYSKSLVGVYQAILTITNLGASLIEILSRVFFPFLNRKKESFSKFMKMMILLVVIIFIGTLSTNKILFWYLNINHESSFWILFVLSIGLFGYTFYNIFGLNYLIVHKKDRIVMENTLKSSLVGFLFAFPLIYFFGALGSAVNLSFSRLLMGGGVFIKYLKY